LKLKALLVSPESPQKVVSVHHWYFIIGFKFYKTYCKVSVMNRKEFLRGFRRDFWEAVFRRKKRSFLMEQETKNKVFWNYRGFLFRSEWGV